MVKAESRVKWSNRFTNVVYDTIAGCLASNHTANNYLTTSQQHSTNLPHMPPNLGRNRPTIPLTPPPNLLKQIPDKSKHRGCFMRGVVAGLEGIQVLLKRRIHSWGSSPCCPFNRILVVPSTGFLQKLIEPNMSFRIVFIQTIELQIPLDHPMSQLRKA